MADVVAEGRLPPGTGPRGPRGRGLHGRRAAAAGGVAPREERVRLVPGGRRLHCHCVAKAREGPPGGWEWEIRVGAEERSGEEGCA